MGDRKKFVEVTMFSDLDNFYPQRFQRSSKNLSRFTSLLNLNKLLLDCVQDQLPAVIQIQFLHQAFRKSDGGFDRDRQNLLILNILKSF